jgi:DNA-binding PadR family transcriptional regulator
MAPGSTRRAARENRTRWVVLGMLTIAPMSGYKLRKAIAESVGYFWQESFGQLYPALRQLASEGLVEGRATPGGPGRGGATYHVTPAGRAALARWLALPPALEKTRNELLLKVFFAADVPPAITLRNLDGVAAGLREKLAAMEQIGRDLRAAEPTRQHPHAPYWDLTLDFGADFCRMAIAWIEKARRVVARPPAPARAARARACRPSRRTATARSSR